MNPDRKSVVSSFYGDRRSSFDPLNNDSQSAHHAARPSAGYNQESFLAAGRQEPLKGGRDEEEADLSSPGWDVYADFNNAGPKYSTAFGQNDNGYRQVPDSKQDEGANTTGPVEMVTVPALGPEWKTSEMREMTKSAKRQRKREAIQSRWKSWNRDQEGFCGGFLTRKALVFGLFGVCIVVGVLLAFTIPRVPGLQFNNDKPLTAASGAFGQSIPASFSRAPANFTFPAYASLQIDTNANFLPLAFKSINAQVYDTDTNMKIATGNIAHQTFPAKTFANFNMPLNFTYVATNDSDQTWVNWYNACKSRSQYVGGTRPGVNFRLILSMDIAGLPSSHGATTDVTSAPCPIELPSNSA